MRFGNIYCIKNCTRLLNSFYTKKCTRLNSFANLIRRRLSDIHPRHMRVVIELLERLLAMAQGSDLASLSHGLIIALEAIAKNVISFGSYIAQQRQINSKTTTSRLYQRVTEMSVMGATFLDQLTEEMSERLSRTARNSLKIRFPLDESHGFRVSSDGRDVEVCQNGLSADSERESGSGRGARWISDALFDRMTCMQDPQYPPMPAPVHVIVTRLSRAMTIGCTFRTCSGIDGSYTWASDGSLFTEFGGQEMALPSIARFRQNDLLSIFTVINERQALLDAVFCRNGVVVGCLKGMDPIKTENSLVSLRCMVTFFTVGDSIRCVDEPGPAAGTIHPLNISLQRATHESLMQQLPAPLHPMAKTILALQSLGGTKEPQSSLTHEFLHGWLIQCQMHCNSKSYRTYETISEFCLFN